MHEIAVNAYDPKSAVDITESMMNFYDDIEEMHKKKEEREEEAYTANNGVEASDFCHCHFAATNAT